MIYECMTGCNTHLNFTQASKGKNEVIVYEKNIYSV